MITLSNRPRRRYHSTISRSHGRYNILPRWDAMTKDHEETKTGIVLRNDMTVDLVQSIGSDTVICKAARVSTLGAESFKTRESAGLINFLMSNRHGTPFEHGSLTFRVEAPIFVWREFMRHRIGFSYNEESGRYKKLQPVFYMPHEKRNLIQTGKPGHYIFQPGDEKQQQLTSQALGYSYQVSWEAYSDLLDAGIAKEVARMCLPVAIYSSAYVTCNPRSLMSFLSLRTKSEVAKFPSYPQAEIETVATHMEDLFADKYPITHASFNTCGRVSP
jgi:thymidylate synthase (FAD)